MRHYVVGACLAAFCAFPAAAQQQITAKSGEEVQAGWIGSVGANCTPNPVPSVQPSKLAQHGQIKLIEGEVQTDSVPECPGIKIPAIVVFYTSSPGYKGTDEFVLAPTGGAEQAYQVTVE